MLFWQNWNLRRRRRDLAETVYADESKSVFFSWLCEAPLLPNEDSRNKSYVCVEYYLIVFQQSTRGFSLLAFCMRCRSAPFNTFVLMKTNSQRVMLLV